MAEIGKLTISAVIPAYNAEKYIARCIDSVLAQTCPVDEVIVVDDGSKDKTADIVRSYGEKVKLVQQPNAGVSAARNTGIRAATGDWIAFLDADDEWLPVYIEKNIEVLRTHPDLVWVISNYDLCSCFEKRRAPRAVPLKAKQLFKDPQVIEDYFFGSLHGFQGCSDTIIIRKTVLMEAGLFKTDLHIGEDLDMWWRIAYRHLRIGLVAESLAVYHIAVPGSGNKKIENWRHFAKIISEHLKLSEEHGRLNSFKPLAKNYLYIWIRGMLFHAQKEDVRQLLHTFKSLIPLWYRCMMYVLTIFPNFTQTGCLLISKIVRTLRLRRRVVLPPNVSKQKRV